MCLRCGTKFTDEPGGGREITTRDLWKTAGDRFLCGSCHADGFARQEAAAEAARRWAAVPEPEDDGQEPGKPRRGLFRRRT